MTEKEQKSSTEEDSEVVYGSNSDNKNGKVKTTVGGDVLTEIVTEGEIDYSNLSTQVEKLLTAFREDPSVTYKELENEFGIPSSKVSKLLPKPLQDLRESYARRLYTQEGWEMEELEEHFDRSDTTLNKWFQSVYPNDVPQEGKHFVCGECDGKYRTKKKFNGHKSSCDDPRLVKVPENPISGYRDEKVLNGSSEVIDLEEKDLDPVEAYVCSCGHFMETHREMGGHQSSCDGEVISSSGELVLEKDLNKSFIEGEDTSSQQEPDQKEQQEEQEQQQQEDEEDEEDEEMTDVLAAVNSYGAPGTVSEDGENYEPEHIDGIDNPEELVVIIDTLFEKVELLDEVNEVVEEEVLDVKADLTDIHQSLETLFEIKEDALVLEETQDDIKEEIETLRDTQDSIKEDIQALQEPESTSEGNLEEVEGQEVTEDETPENDAEGDSVDLQEPSQGDTEVEINLPDGTTITVDSSDQREE